MKSMKQVLANSFRSLRSKYFTNIIVVFLASFIIGGGYHLVSAGGNPNSSFNTKLSYAEILLEFVEGYNPVTPSLHPNVSNYSRGVLSVFVNQIADSGSIGFGILNGLNTLLFHGQIARSVVIFSFVFLAIFLTIFVRNIIYVGRCRYFLEHRCYTETPPSRLLFVFQYGQVKNVALVMFLRMVFQLLYALTIVMIPIKYYEYSMIPYILAENPSLHWREAFRLSKEMTTGKKRTIFLYDLLLLPILFLSSLTYNYLTVFFLAPFRECLFAEIYMDLRREKWSGQVILVASATSPGEIRHIFKDPLLLDNTVIDGEYPEAEFHMNELPGFSFLHADYKRDYTPLNFTLFFFTFSFVGWIWEVIYYLVSDGIAVNRGVLHGPWLPIYGVGGFFVILVLKPLRENPLHMFIGSFVVCGLIEYLASVLLEVLFHQKWWDYNGFFLNINGRVCLEGLMVFGLAGIAFTYFITPMLDSLYNRFSVKRRTIAAGILCVVFVLDLIYSYFHPNTGNLITF